MEDRKLNERESLELIAQMIRNTRRNLDAGGGNMFLLWGYTGVVVTLGVWAALYFTNCTACLWGFWTLPVVGWLLSWWFGRRWRKQQGAKGLYRPCSESGVADDWHCLLWCGCVCYVVSGLRTDSAVVCHAGFAGQPAYGHYHPLYPVFGIAFAGLCLESGAGVSGGFRRCIFCNAACVCRHCAAVAGYPGACVEPSGSQGVASKEVRSL